MTLGDPNDRGAPMSGVMLINVFEVPIEHVGRFVAEWRERAALLATKPGFIDTRLHRALSADARFQLVNVAHWTSRDAWQAAIADMEFQRKSDAVRERMPVAANPALYEVVVDLRAPRPPEASTDQL